MIAGDGVVKILLADTKTDRLSLLISGLVATGLHEVAVIMPGENLRDAVVRTQCDLVIVDMARGDRDALDQIRTMARHDPRPVAMFVDHDDPAFMEAAIEAGVSSYTVIGAVLPDVKPIMAAAVALFRRYRLLETALIQAEQSLKHNGMVDRAKIILMRRHGFGEPDAHRWLQRQAMTRSQKIIDIAVEIVVKNNALPGQGKGADDAV